MNDNLAKAVASCRLFRWMPGMACRDPERETPWRRHDGYWCNPGSIAPVVIDAARLWQPLEDAKEFGPDLTDPATAGCLWALVREAQHEENVNDAYNLRHDMDFSWNNPRGGIVVAHGDGDDCHDVSSASTDGERAAECLLWLAEKEPA